MKLGRPVFATCLRTETRKKYGGSAYGIAYVWLPHFLTSVGLSREVRSVSSVVSAVRCRWCMILSWPLKSNDVSGLPALIRAKVIIFVIVWYVQLSYYFSCLLICSFRRERLFMLFMCVRLRILFIRERLFIVFTKERLFMLFKFTCTVYKSQIN